MKKLLFLLAAVTAAVSMSAAPVDQATALKKAQSFLSNQFYAGKIMASSAVNPVLLKAEMGNSKLGQPVYYIYNTSTTFVVVAGDDRAEEILMVGDRPLKDINNLPLGLQDMLGQYKDEMMFLQEHPGLKVEPIVSPQNSPTLRAETYGPLLTCNWDQEAPYYNQCKFGNYQCLTGCPATSASMVFYYWKYPTDPTPVVPGYSSTIYTSYYGGTSYNHSALASTTFDWDNMLDDYTGSYSTAQGTAVATLMHYVGQAERMEYGTTSVGSGVSVDSVSNICDAFLLFGYDPETTHFVKKVESMDNYGNEGATIYSDSEWAAMIQEEMAAGRPIVFCAVSTSGGGHAFNVDGYNGSTNKYHINFGWSGDGNAWCSLNSFGYSSYNFNVYQQMVIGIQPPQATNTPKLTVTPTELEMNCYAGETATATFTLTGTNLTDKVNVTLTDANGVFSVNPTSVSVSNAEAGKVVTVTFAPETYGTFNGTVTCSSTDAADVTVALTGTATLEKGSLVLLDADADYVTSTSFRADWTDATPSANVASYTLYVNQQGFEEAEEVATADFTSFAATGQQTTAVSNLDSYCSPSGWTGTVYPGNGGVKLGYSSSDYVGTLTTPALDFSKSGGKLTITFTANSYAGGGGGGSSTLASLVIQTGDHTYTQALTSSSASYTIVLDCDAQEGQTVSFTSANNRVLLSTINITTTDVTTTSFKAVAEEGDATYRIVTGITDKFYTVENLTPASTYFFKVKALYVDGTESNWSDTKEVTLLEAAPSFILGDVNNDGYVTIADVTALIDYLLGGGDINEDAADLDGDNTIAIKDVTALIDLLLGSN